MTTIEHIGEYLLKNTTVHHSDSTLNMWNSRYTAGGNSGSGSYGKMGKWKINTLRQLIKTYAITSITDIGCGDGTVCREIPHEVDYVGYDVISSINKCKSMMPNKRFKLITTDRLQVIEKSDATLSLDVLYHLLTADERKLYMQRLFSAARRFVIIYSCDLSSEAGGEFGSHVALWKFTSYVSKNFSNWILDEVVKNPFYTLRPRAGHEETWSNYFVYIKLPIPFDKFIPYTLVTKERLQNLAYHVARFNDQPVAFVECGVARGGCIALMSYLAGAQNTVWGFDSFKPMPSITQEDAGKGVRGDEAASAVGLLCGTEAQILKTCRHFNVTNANIVKLWFDKGIELYKEKIGPIGVLRLDSDWYMSTMYLLEVLYDQVVFGGVIIVDDYGHFSGCKKAVDEFRDKYEINDILHVTDYTERWWIKGECQLRDETVNPLAKYVSQRCAREDNLPDFTPPSFEYGISAALVKKMNMPGGDNICHSDIISYVINTFNLKNFLEIGVSVGKNIWNICNSVDCKTSIYGIDLAPQHSSILNLNLNYIRGNELDVKTWINLSYKLGKKTINIVYSDGYHSGESMMVEYKMMRQYKIVDFSKPFMILYDDLGHYKFKRDYFKEIYNSVCNVHESINCHDTCFMRIFPARGWLGNNVALHVFGMITNIKELYCDSWLTKDVSLYHLCKTKYGQFNVLDNDWIGQCFISDKHYSQYLFEKIYDYIPQHKNIVDVGANIGSLAIPFAQLTSGEVYAFEPQKKIFKILESNKKLNNANNLCNYNVALGDYDGPARMSTQYELHGSMHNINDSGAGIKNYGAIGIGTDGEKIDMKRLDDYKFKNIGLIKIDVEGAEMHVLTGARNLIASQRPYVVYEYQQEMTRTVANNYGARTNIKEFFSSLRYTLNRLTEKDFLAIPPRDEIVVTLTTISSRVQNVHKCIQSILDQSLPPNRILLFISSHPYLFDKGINEIPEKLLAMPIEIRYVENTGPYRKLLPALELYRNQPDVILVTVDDDVTYPSDWLKFLYETHKKYNCAVGYRGYSIQFDEHGNLVPYNQWILHQRNLTNLYHNFATGRGGVLYTPEMFDDTVFDKEYLILAPTNDDVWFKLCTIKTVTGVYIVGRDVEDIEIYKDTLYKYNCCGADRNTECFKNVLSYFNMTPQDIFKMS